MWNGEEFAFEEWAKQNELTKKTTDALEKEDLVTFKALTAIKMEQVDDPSLGLTIGQKAILKQAIKELTGTNKAPVKTQGFSPNSDQDKTDSEPTTKSLDKDEELNALLDSMSDAHLRDLLSLNDSKPGSSSDKDGNSKGEKPLLVPDHLSKHIYSDENEKTLIVKGDTEFVLRTHKAKKQPEEVSLPQWVSANARILKKNINNGKANMQAVLEYLDYTIQFGDYCQLYTIPSMMLLDDAHRRRQSDEDSKMSDISQHQFRFLLKSRNQAATGSTNVSQQSKSKKTDDRGRPVCRDFNQSTGCRFPKCKYAHICLICKGNHPQFQHDSVPPRFRGGYSSGIPSDDAANSSGS